MKLYIKYKDGIDLTIVETDFVNLIDNELNYFNDNREYNEELSNLDILKLDGEVLYRDSENKLDLEEFVKLFTNVFMGIKEIEKRSIEEYKKEKENVE